MLPGRYLALSMPTPLFPHCRCTRPPAALGHHELVPIQYAITQALTACHDFLPICSTAIWSIWAYIWMFIVYKVGDDETMMRLALMKIRIQR